jgi:hypothetical protein
MIKGWFEQRPGGDISTNFHQYEAMQPQEDCISQQG